jgi:membrane dipeptidase
MLIVDSHLDLAMSALEWDRDLRLSAMEMRRLEEGMTGKGRAAGTVGFPDMREGRIFLSFATLFGRVAWPGSGVSGYRTTENAYGHAQGHLGYYRLLQDLGEVRLIADRPALERHLVEWSEPVQGRPPLGFVISMEGADPILSPAQVERWWQDGLRIASLCHYGISHWAHGTGNPGGLLPGAREMLSAMAEVGMVLDVSHLADQAMFEALDAFPGRMLASHHNCRALVPGDRQLTDEMIKLLVQRDAVIGAALDAWMLYPGWVRGETSNLVVSLEDYVNHIDHVCQVAGDARHAAIGSDLDGGYGYEQTPHDLHTIADVQQVAGILGRRGDGEDSIALIMHGNLVRMLRETLPG